MSTGLASIHIQELIAQQKITSVWIEKSRKLEKLVTALMARVTDLEASSIDKEQQMNDTLETNVQEAVNIEVQELHRIVDTFDSRLRELESCTGVTFDVFANKDDSGLDEIRKSVEDLGSRLDDLDSQVDTLDSHVSKLDSEVEAVDSRINKLYDNNENIN